MNVYDLRTSAGCLVPDMPDFQTNFGKGPNSSLAGQNSGLLTSPRYVVD